MAGSDPGRRVALVTAISTPVDSIRIVQVKVYQGPPLEYRAGQFARLTFASQPPRDYSLASPPGNGELEFHIRVSDPRSVSAFVGKKLRVGDKVAVEGPFGDAWFRAEDSGLILAIGGGTGIVPVKSIVEAALAQRSRDRIYLYFGARTESDLYLDSHFCGLVASYPSLTYVPVLSEPEGKTHRRTGGVAEAVAADLDSVSGFRVYVAGPPPMVNAAWALLSERGLKLGRIHADPLVSDDHHSAPALVTAGV